ncbi:Uncharacterized protein, UPF0303 family [Cohaesibacter sp. ES.047]|uniref:heme-degrading domain-containing protein n=1 Tax=Cohaesibacter sp. ES.047 TaxID=1798205 RepID=UPI000BB904A3|nr:heme-degrading domain-containing protein [Cohaesibacter sp. ES.047]SNY93182.1 Uncharacterized protein, UPF0303 family [Cohaesibacter sp. ES.047]
MAKLTDLNDTDLLAELSAHEEDLRFETFSVADAHEVGRRLVALAEKRSLSIAIDITCGDHCLFHMALKGTSPDNAQWILRKRRVVNRFHHSSLFMGATCRLAGQSLEQKYMLPDNQFAAHGGAFPIRLKDGAVIGTVTVSGLPQIEDHALVVEVLQDYLKAS